MILVIDNYDSFTFNLVQQLGGIGAECDVIRNDKFEIGDVLSTGYHGLVISPGPCTPNETGKVMPLLAQLPDNFPVFGVCLGHQCLVQSHGGKIVLTDPSHGKVSQIKHRGHPMFRGIPSPFAATRYHSLTAEPTLIPDALEVTALCGDIVMSVAERLRPRYGVQFHPESIGTPFGRQLIFNFINTCREYSELLANDNHKQSREHK